MSKAKEPNLPSGSQRELLCELLAGALIEIRALGWADEAEQAAALADAFHNLPREMYGWGRFDWGLLRGSLEDYQERHPGRSGPDYVRALDRIRQAS